MRQDFDRQLKIDIPSLDEIEFDPSSRHELEPILMALKHIYDSQEILTEILKLISEDVSNNSNANTGCPGLSYWEILVLAAVRLGCNLDYDALADLASNHRKLRRILGIGDWEEDRTFARSTIQDNIAKIKTETIERISHLIVSAGHELVPKAIEKVRGDSFVVQTNIHYPTDSSLIVDSVRKSLSTAAKIGRLFSVTTWQNWRLMFRPIKRLHRKIQKVAASKKLTKSEKQEKFENLYVQLISRALDIAGKGFDFRGNIDISELPSKKKQHKAQRLDSELIYYLGAIVETSDIASRRVLNHENIPNQEKVFSIFEPHTELINRGKVPYPIEFGHRVLVTEDQVGFIVDHHILKDGQTDEKIVIDRLTALQERMKWQIKVASFDKGFWSPENLEKMEDIVEIACLPKKGKLNSDAKIRENSTSFRQARRWHPGVESAIHALISGNGLTVCRDRGSEGYDRYVALGIMGRNLHTLGRILLDRAHGHRKQRRLVA